MRRVYTCAVPGATFRMCLQELYVAPAIDPTFLLALGGDAYKHSPHPGFPRHLTTYCSSIAVLPKVFIAADITRPRVVVGNG